MKEIILKYVKQLDNLPALPEVSLSIMNSLQDEKTSLNEAVQIIRKDPSLVIRIMKVANSARYGGAMKVTALEVAAGRLGMEMLKKLAVVDSIMNLFPCKKGGYDSRSYWEHSLCTAFVSENLLRQLKDNPNIYLPKKIECFTSSLLHGVGMLILELGFGESTKRIIQYMNEEGLSLHETEIQLIGISNPECGEILCKYWQLPEMVTSAIRWHLEPESSPDDSRGLCELIYIAKYIALHQNINESIFTANSLKYNADTFNKYGLGDLSEEDMKSMANKALENSLSII